MTATNAYLMFEAGYQDRMRQLPPQSSDADYFRGYCRKIIDEIHADHRAEVLAA